MILQTIPFAVIALSALAVLLLPLGTDVLVAIFLLPWEALTPDIGVNLPIFKILYGLLVVKYAAFGRFKPSLIPHHSMLSIVMLIGTYAALITLTTVEHNAIFEGGEARNGWLRSVVAMLSFSLSFVGIAIILSAKGNLSAASVLRVYVMSVIMLCVMGIVQYFIYSFAHLDVFPIGMFKVSPEQQRTGLLMFGGVQHFRPSAMAGEPKNLGMYSASAVILMLAFGSALIDSVLVRLSALVVCLIALFLTQSSSALLSIFVGGTMLLYLRMMGRSLKLHRIFLIYFLTACSLLAVYFYSVENVGTESLPERVAADVNTSSDNFADLIYSRTVGRLEVEDFDRVIVKSFIEDPFALLLGRGFGLGHMFVDQYIPRNNRRYMANRIVAPKSGIILFLVNAGLLSFPLMLVFLARLTLGSQYSELGRTSGAIDVRSSNQSAIIPLVILFLMRSYIFDVVLVVGACANLGIGLRDRKHRPGANKIPGYVMKSHPSQRPSIDPERFDS